MENSEKLTIDATTIKSLEKILKTEKKHIKTAIRVTNEAFEKFQPENVWFSLNAGKDNTVALLILAAVCYKRFKKKIETGPLPADSTFDKLVRFTFNYFLIFSASEMRIFCGR